MFVPLEAFRTLFCAILNFRSECRRNAKPFVLTDALKKSFEMVALAVSQRWPVLLYGPAGSGKTALINKLAQEQGSQGMVLLFKC